MPPTGIEPVPPDFQSGVRTSYTRAALNFGRGSENRTHLHRVQSPGRRPCHTPTDLAPPVGISPHSKFRNVTSKPTHLTLRRHLFGWPGRDRTRDMLVNSEPLYQLSYWPMELVKEYAAPTLSLCSFQLLSFLQHHRQR